MVEFDEPTTANLATVDGGAPTETKLCRLCLKHQEFCIDLFEEPLDEATTTKKPAIATQLNELFQVNYAYSILLPKSICRQCLLMAERFSSFRDGVQQCEATLQSWLENSQKRVVERAEDLLPGLNGNPGVFEPDESYEITEVDPDQEHESSDDDFSMESDSENEEMSQQPTQSNPTMQYTTNAAPVDSELAATNSSEQRSAPTTSTSGDLSMYSMEMVVKNTFLCQFCDMAFTTQPDCVEHESRHDAGAPFACSFCPVRTPTRPTLIYHIKEEHDAERPYVCALCNKGFCRRSDLKKHTIVHTGVRPFTCPVCAKSFSRNTNLTKHMRIHSSVRPHVCQRCPRSFTTAAELMRHARSHTEIKPFQCSRCSASFTRKDKLQLHEQAHFRRESEFLLNQSKTGINQAALTGEDLSRNQLENIVVPLNPYGEQQELIAYGANSNMSSEDPYRNSILAAQLQQPRSGAQSRSVSLKTHSHTRQFNCDICAKSFTRERDLQRHQALHLDTLFTCKQCGIGFSRREKLTRHEHEHHAPQYPCEICRITFTKIDALERHLKMHELQQNVALTTQAAISAASGAPKAPLLVAPPKSLAAELPLTQRPSAADLSFYSQMVPTMNLGFYSETRPEDRNGL